MRFIARYGRYAVQVRPHIQEHYATGQSRTIQSALVARFHEGLLLPAERELALTHWTFNGFYQEQDEVTQVAPDYRIGLFDSRAAQIEQGWTDEDRKTVEEELERLALANPSELLLVVGIRAEAPWPNYDVYDGSINDLCTKVIEDGYDLDEVLAYEESAQDRPEIIAALKQLIVDQEAPVGAAMEEIVG
jgi:hypothetical protein